MNMKYLFKPLIMISIVVFLLTGCRDDGNDFTGDGPEIEWISGGTTMTYNYSRGVVIGYDLKRSFTVSKQSGDVIIEVQIKGDNESKADSTFAVENGKTYGISVRAGIKGREVSNGAQSCLTVVFSSPNCRENYEIPVHSYLVMSSNEWVPDMEYCPESLSFGEFSISN